MLRLKTVQPDFWDDILPPEARRMSPDLEAVDARLDDEAFLAPFQRRFPAKRGRYTIPMETYLRLMYLKVQVLGGNPHVKDRLVSLFDPDARPIRKGKLNIAGGTEFGYKVVVSDEERGFVTDYAVTPGNPQDGTLLVAAVERHAEVVGRVPRAVATDRGMASAGNVRALQTMGVWSSAVCRRPGPRRPQKRPPSGRVGSGGCNGSALVAKRASACSSASRAGGAASCEGCQAPRRGSAGELSPIT